jgi:hypothetical protein
VVKLTLEDREVEIVEDDVKFEELVDGSDGNGIEVMSGLGELLVELEFNLGVLELTSNELESDHEGLDGIRVDDPVPILEDKAPELELLELELIVLQLLDSPVDELDEAPDDAGEVTGPDTSDVEDEGQENMLELGPCVTDDEELTSLGGVEDEEVATGTEVVKTNVRVVVRPEVIRVDVVVITEAIVVVAELSRFVEGLGREIVKPPLCGRLARLVEIVAAPLEGLEDGERVA